MPGPIRSKYTKELLLSVVCESFSWADVCRKLNLGYNGGNHASLKRITTNHNIDYSHFTGSGHNKGKLLLKKHFSEILVRRLDGGRSHGQAIRRALVRSGISDVCSECGQLPSHNGKTLTLQTDHKDGDYTNNTPGNVRILCPNCHSQTDTFCGRSKRKNVVN